MRSVFMGSRRLGGETVAYHLLIQEVEGLGENYGVLLEGFGQTAAVLGITAVQDRALSLLDLLCRCDVPPAGLRDVVEDWLLL